MERQRSKHDHVTTEQALDKGLRAAQARFTGGISPIALTSAFSDWALHLMSSPGKQLALLEAAAKKAKRFGAYITECSRNPQGAENCIAPLQQDSRFRDEAWQKWPFNMMSQAFLLNQQFLHNMTSNVEGVTQQHEDVVTFTTRQCSTSFRRQISP
jgi:polyhydroxyalkanoate synthase